MGETQHLNSNDLAAHYGCLLASAEVGLGSLLHAFHIPLTGQCLSLNQVFLLSHAMSVAKGEEDRRYLPAAISSLAATLKSLSPAGKKLTPMLAIAMQGWLFNSGTLLFGNNVVGRAAGAAISSIWAFVQPLLFIGLVFGLEWNKLYAAVAPYVPFSNVVMVIATAVAVKLLAAVGLSFAAVYLPQQKIETYFARLNKLTPVQQESAVRKRTWWESLRKKLLKPIFLVPFVTTLFVAYWVEGEWLAVLWVALRSLAVASLMFVGMRVWGAERLLRSSTPNP